MHPRVLRVRSRSAAADLLVRTGDNFRVHRTGRNATLVAHYGFLSVFPLLLVFTTVLGFVLESRPRLRETIIDSAFSRIPIIGHQLQTNPNELTGNAVVLVAGLLLALWAGMRAFNALQVALDDIADIPQDDRLNLLRTRGRSLLGIAVVGISQVAAATLTGFIGVTGVPGLIKIGFALSAVAVNTAVLAAVYRWLCLRTQSWRQVAPGAIVGGVAFAVLQVAGTAVVGRSIARASPVYGTFASVIGLITWLGLHSTIALLGAELNRALPARPYSPPEPALLTPDA
jgi:membrane protein